MADKTDNTRLARNHGRGAVGSMLSTLPSVLPPNMPPLVLEAPEVSAGAPRGAEEPSVTVADGSYIEIDTALIRPWRYRNRGEEEMGDMEAFIECIAREGQQVPIFVREVAGVPGVAYEYFAGHRRYTACKSLGRPVKAIVRNLDDRHAAIAQELENRFRQDVSPWTKAATYRKYLDDGVFPSESALAAHLDVGRSTLNELFCYFRLPTELISAVGSFSRVSINTAKQLIAICKEPDGLQLLLPHAADIRTGKLKGPKIRELSGEVSPVRVIKTKSGRDAFSIRKDSNGTPVLALLKDGRELISMEELEAFLRSHFDRLESKGQ